MDVASFFPKVYDDWNAAYDINHGEQYHKGGDDFFYVELYHVMMEIFGKFRHLQINGLYKGYKI